MAQKSHFLSLKETPSFSTACSAAWGALTGMRTRGRTLLPSPHPHRQSLSGAMGASTSPSPSVTCHNALTFHRAPLAHWQDTPHCTDGETEAGWVTADGLLLPSVLLPAHLQGESASSPHTSCRDVPKPNSSTSLSHRQSARRWIWVPAKV